MDVIIVSNGLGNQMSQYALFLRKKGINGSTRFIFDRRSKNTHNGYDLKRVFDIDYRETFGDYILFLIFRVLSIERWPLLSGTLFTFLSFVGIKLIKENVNYDFDKNILKPSKGLTFYYGGWHSEKYFKDIKGEILNTFNFKYFQNDERLERLIMEIGNCQSVSVHVRRGDFLIGKNMLMYGAVCSKEYFDTAIAKIHTLVHNPHFYVFSNDVPWVRENLNHDNMTIVDFNSREDSWKDMLLMSHCKHNINSNSTFSWWGAWLNSNKHKKVIVPYFFINNLTTKDFYPESWTKIKGY